MKLILLLCTFSLFACSQQTPENAKAPAIPEPLEDNSGEYTLLSKGRGYDDLVQELYNDIVEKNKSLQELEMSIKNIQSSKFDSLKAFTNFNQKNATYYATANKYLGQIKDTVLRKQMENTFIGSNAKYKNLIQAQQNLADQTAALSAKLNDLHIMLKLTTTLAVMERYQQSQLPSKQSTAAINQTYTQLLFTIDSLLKK
jgi:hypothetical protein